MANSAYQKIQVVGTSTTNLSDAVRAAVKKAATLVKNPYWFEVVEQRGAIVNGEVHEFQVTIAVGAKLE